MTSATGKKIIKKNTSKITSNSYRDETETGLNSRSSYKELTKTL